MAKLSDFLHILFIGNTAQGAMNAARLQNGNLNNVTGAWTPTPGGTGPDLFLINGSFKAQNKVWSAVWNDFADFQLLADQLIHGKCYFDTIDGAKICNQRCQLSAIGIASDTFGLAVGQGRYATEVPIAVAGWVLAFVDKIYASGTPLTNDENGNLTEMTLEEKRNFPERLLAIFKKTEPALNFGNNQVQVPVAGRFWVKVK